MVKRSVTSINQNWTFKQADRKDAKFLPVAQFPTNVHLDLLANDMISDPFIGKNEVDCQWVGEATWIYRTTFATDQSLYKEPSLDTRAVLAFDGLDTFATVVLNGKEILKTENMFIPERVDVKSLLKKDEENVLEITFESAFLRGKKIVEEHPEHKWGCWNSDLGRLAVRKAQYHWGWDWGPTLLTCGPWKPINLEVYRARISDLFIFDIKLDENLKSAKVAVIAEVEGSTRDVRFRIYDSPTNVIMDKTVKIANENAYVDFTIKDPELWYPAGYGNQPLYSVVATLTDRNNVKLDSKEKDFGIRRAELIQRPLKDQPGTSFFFRINNIPIFCGGSNWIPADNFLPRIPPYKYRDWVKLVADGNQRMIRVWGGGVYEDDTFYDACDQYGILVWQDFLFGCGNYPAHPSFLESVKREATANVKRLRHHPSIVIWAGNNEDYQYQESEGLTYDPENKDAESWLKTNFPARYIYEKLLPEVCKELVPDTYYHPGSPFGGTDTRDPTVGDIHQWNVWHGTQEKYQNWDQLAGRFVSEFGMEAFPDVRTVDGYLPKGKDDEDRYSQSEIVDWHNKADGHERRLALYLVENIRYSPEPLEYFIYCTQLMQAECLSSAYRLWRRQWKGPGREYCGGALVWQIDDCWPVTSWSIVDYLLRPKLAYWAIKREMGELAVGMKRVEKVVPRDRFTRVYVERTYHVEIWGSNLGLRDRRVDVVVMAWNVEAGERTYCATIKERVLLLQNHSTELADMEVPVKVSDVGEEGRTVVAAYLVEDGVQVARYINWPEPLKYVHLQRPKHLKVEVSQDGKRVDVSAEVAVKGVALDCEDEDVKFEDNCVDLVPGEIVSIAMKGGDKETKIGAKYLGMV